MSPYLSLLVLGALLLAKEGKSAQEGAFEKILEVNLGKGRMLKNS